MTHLEILTHMAPLFVLIYVPLIIAFIIIVRRKDAADKAAGRSTDSWERWR